MDLISKDELKVGKRFQFIVPMRHGTCLFRARITSMSKDKEQITIPWESGIGVSVPRAAVRHLDALISQQEIRDLTSDRIRSLQAMYRNEQFRMKKRWRRTQLQRAKDSQTKMRLRSEFKKEDGQYRGW